MVVGARQSFQFFRQNTWFLENNRALPKFLYGILHYIIIITKASQLKTNFILTMRATYLRPCQTPKAKLFVKKNNDF